MSRNNINTCLKICLHSRRSDNKHLSVVCENTLKRFMKNNLNFVTNNGAMTIYVRNNLYLVVN